MVLSIYSQVNTCQITHLGGTLMIEEHQEFHANNLLSFRASLTQAEMQKEMQNLEKFINDNNLTIVGPKISTTYSVSQGIVPTMDLEILVPISSLY